MNILCVTLLLLSAIAVKAQSPAISGYTGNPFLAGYFADPCIITQKGNFYIYATIDPWGADSLQMFVSNDFKKWTSQRLNWPTKQLCKSPTSQGSKVWAPSVIKGRDGKFHMFVSVGSEVYAGVSDAPGGPWKNVRDDQQPFITTQKAINVHTIDAEAFMDDDGQAYLYWGSGFEYKDGHCFIGKLNKTMDAFIDTPRDITPPSYFEAPYMIKKDGVYYLTYSDGNCNDASYKVQYSTSTTPFGPWTKGLNSPILSSNTELGIIGPGHHTILKNDNKYYIVYHRISTKKPGLNRQLCIDELHFGSGGTIVKVIPTNTGVKVSNLAF